ncbi:MAG: STAS domain-containing protein [Boseongicola sp. SB0675_bin_26]|nr:STAS domain-containing protein [Boseongicola sp. SB0675_bin_26]
MTPAFRNLGSELREDVLSAKAVPALSAGFTSGLALLVAEVAFASFIFSGALAPYSSQGIGMILFGNFAACLIVALTGGYRGAVAGLSPPLVVIMALIASTTDGQGKPLFITVACALMIGSFATGICCLMIGHFRLANLVRFIPYPVAAGFVSGIGGTVCLAAISLMGAGPDWQTASALLDPAVLWAWLPGTAYGTALYFAMKRWRNALILPASAVAAVGAYHLALGVLGVSGEEARAAGLLLASTTDGGLWPALLPADLALVEWSSLAAQIPNILTLMLIAFICVVMNIAGLELAVNQDLEWNREFKACGTASVIASFGGATVATLIVPTSLRSKLLNATTRLTGIVAASVVGFALFLGDEMLEFVPAALVGGILIFAGLGMLDEGLAKNRKLLPRAEFAIVLMIFAVILLFGLIEGVGAGMLATLVFFTVRLSRIDLIESEFTVRERRSNKARSIPDGAILLEEGGRAHVYRLRGYIFFGSADPLISRLRKTVDGPSRPVCLMLDFTAVSGFDFSAVNALSRFLWAANEAGTKVVLSAVSDQLSSSMRRSLPEPAFEELILKPDTDRALECCEDIVISAWREDATAAEGQRTALLEHVGHNLERHLERQIEFENLMHELRDWLTPCEYAAEESLAGADGAGVRLQFLISGRASARDGKGLRLHQFGPGDAIGQMDAFGAQTASVVADEPCRTMALTSSARRRLETDEEGLAFKLYRYLLVKQFGLEQKDGIPAAMSGATERPAQRNKGTSRAEEPSRPTGHLRDQTS